MYVLNNSGCRPPTLQRLPLAERQRIRSPTPEPILLQPSEEYLHISQVPSVSLDDPASCRKLLVLDLNGTLLYRSPHQRRFIYDRQPRGDRDRDKTSPAPQLIEVDPYKIPGPRRLRPVHPRPFMPSFREYLFHPDTREWLDTMVWSSAQPHSVADMVEKAFAEHKDDLIAVWARDTLGLESRDYNRKAQTTKDLEKPWLALTKPPLNDSNSTSSSTKNPASHSALTTFLLDDSPLKAQLQPWNHLCIHEYTGAMRQADLDTLRKPALPPSNVPLRPLTKAERKAAKAQKNADKKNKRKARRAAEKLAENGAVEPDATLDKKDKEEEAVHDDIEEERGVKRKIDDEAPASPSKKLKISTESLPPEPAAPLPPFDNTLLAVIGVLDTVKLQSNVSNWAREGGLFGLGGALAEDGLECVPPSSSQPSPSSSPLPLDDKKEVDNETEDSQPKVKMWFDDTRNVDFWVKRGIAALQALNIPITHGIKDYQ
ncbi:hypothetical protein DL96DRAFT_1583908 [Flagelloscypha sp. PMI_526]|nr:hypothetical protein DL96DRAFT_1583908 [Flagelloscypha sp. PMI_526]